MPRLRLHIDDKIVCGALGAVSLVPVVLALIMTVRHWAPLPYWDEWFTPGELLRSYAYGTLSFHDFFLQHNESRKVFPRMVYLVLAKLHGWDVRDGMVLTLLEVATISGLCFFFFLRTRGATAVAACLAFTLTAYLCFCPSQYENFLWGLQWEPFFPGMAVMLVALVNLSPLHFATKTAINLSLALVATYTFANGILLWLLAIPLATKTTPERSRIRWYSIYGLIGVASIGVYFIGYHRPVEHPKFHFDIAQTIHYIILWTGGYYNSKNAWPFATGAIVLALLLSALANVTLLIKRGADWRYFYAWVLISIYALASSIITAVGRSGFGIEQALASRYRTFSLFAYLGLIGTTFTLHCYYRDRDAGRNRVIVAVAIVAIALSIPGWRGCLHDSKQVLVQTAERNSRLLCALSWINILPKNPDLKLIFPYPDVLRLRVNALAKVKLLVTHLVSEQLIDRLNPPVRASDTSNGYLEQSKVKENSLIASGWAWRPGAGPRPDCILVGLRLPNGRLEPLSVTPLRGPRPGIEGHYRRASAEALAFYCTFPILKPIAGSIEAWAVDSAAEVVSPLGGATPVASR